MIQTELMLDCITIRERSLKAAMIRLIEVEEERFGVVKTWRHIAARHALQLGSCWNAY
jgi:predicted RNA-binding protein YlxR (DUF448 family)